MLRSFFIIAIRNLSKNRLYTAINVLGLSLGIACCLIIFVLVRYETSFDDYHSKADRIYRVNLHQQNSAGRQFNGCNYSPLADAIRNEVTGLEKVTGVYCLQTYQFAHGSEIFENRYAFFADQSYFDVFDVGWIAGNREQSLTSPGKAVVTERFADTFLGGARRALGQTLVLENKLTLSVSGIVATPPSNTDHPFSMLISYPSLAQFMPETVDNWQTVGSGATYVVFHERTQEEQVYAQFGTIINKYLEEDVAKNTRFHLMPLNDNHDRNYDYTSFTYDFPVPVMIILSTVAGMIAFIACMNYVNLATAQSLKRAREVGLRKTMGSRRADLVMQYMSEAFLITLFAVMTALVLAQTGLVQLNKRYDANILQLNFLEDPAILLFTIGVVVTVSILAGFYPAFILSGYKPVLALRSQTYSGASKGLSLRRALVILQFIATQMLIIVTIVMINQIGHFRDRPLSFDASSIVLIPALRGNESQQHDRLRHELQAVPGVVTCSFGNAGNDTAELTTVTGSTYPGIIVSYVDTSYLHTFGMTLIAGSNLSATNASSGVVVNEAFTGMLGFESAQAAIGSVYTLNDEVVTIRGVVRDTYTQPMSDRVDPVVLVHDPSRFAGVAIKISTVDISGTLAGIEQAWKRVYPDFICKYHFMDQSLKRQYGFYNLIFSFLGTASFLAIFIGCLGLYGLVSFMAIQRTKEIGIRKVFGATVPNIMMMFTKESMVLITVAFIIAAPLGHVIGIGMLMELPERVPPGIGIFAATFAGSLLIALFTVSYRSLRAARQNPGESLRFEG